jgi:hypothetical protein
VRILGVRLVVGGGRDGVDDGVQDLLEVAMGEVRVAVARRDHLALLGQLEPPAHRLAGLGPDRGVRGAAPAADGAAPAVEERQRHPVPVGDPHQRPLRAVELPRGGEVPAVLVGVAVAHHDLLVVAAPADVPPVARLGQEPVEDLRRALEVVHGLEQRDDVEPVVDPGVASHDQDGEHVGGALGHRDHVRVDGVRADAVVRAAHEPEQPQRLVRLRVEVEHGRGQGAGLVELAREDLHAPVLVESLPVVAVAVPGEHRREGAAVTARVLAQVEGHEVEAEHLRLDLEVADPAVRQRVAVDAAQALAQRDEVGDQLAGVCVHTGAGAVVRAPGAGRRRLGAQQHLVDQREVLAVGLAGIAPVDVLGLGRQRAPELVESTGELLRGPAAGAHRQVRVQPVDAAPQQAQREGLGLAQGLLGDLGGHVGVAVPVATDPGPQPEEAPHVGLVRALGGQRLAELAVQTRHEVVDPGVDPVQPVADLVDHGGRPHAGLVGEPQRRHLLGEVALDPPAFLGCQAVAVEAAQRAGDPGELGEHRAALGLGRVGGEHRPHLQARDGLGEPCRAVPFVLRVRTQPFGEPVDRRGQAVGEMAVARALAVLEQPSDQRLVLGEVDQPEPGRERGDDGHRLVRGDLAEPLGQARPGVRVATTVGDGQAADLLDQLEVRLALDLRDGPSEVVAEQPDLSPCLLPVHGTLLARTPCRATSATLSATPRRCPTAPARTAPDPWPAA